MPDLSIQLQPKQHQLLRGLEAIGPDVPIRWGWGGARGAAKSGGLRRIAMILATTYTGIVVTIVRKHFGDLIENHVEKMYLEYPEFHSKYWRPSASEWKLPNGSRINLAYGDTERDVQEFSRGPEITFLLVDQAEQFTEKELVWLTIPNRWPSAQKGFAKSCFFFNPGGPGTSFLRRVFYLRNFEGNELSNDWAFIQAYGWDNYEWFRGQVDIEPAAFYALDSETRFEMFISRTSEGRKMNALPGELRLGELLGSFEHFSGQYFAEVWGEHCVLSVQESQSLIQPWWRRWMAQDWGFGDHAAHFWFATGKVSPDSWVRLFGGRCDWPMDVVVVYRELVIAGRAEGDLAMDIVKMTPEPERKQIAAFYLSQDAPGQRARQTSIHGQNTVGQAFSTILQRHGLPQPSTADQDRVNGHRFLYGCFRQAKLRGCNIDAERAKEGPALFVAANCVAAIDNIPLAVRDDKDPNDVMRVPGVVWEDIVDGLRYGLKSKLDPKRRAPVEVRAAEVMESAPDPTARHIRMLHFQQEEARRGLARRGTHWRG